jgi:Zn-dependent protease with chaperone function
MNLQMSQIQRYVDDVFRAFKVKDNDVEVEIISKQVPFAGASGARIMGSTYGKIMVSEGLIKKLDKDEIRFVLAHEATHIYMNHLPLRLFSDLIRGSISALAYRYPPALIALLTAESVKYLQYKTGQLTGEASLTRSQEIQADVWGIIITGTKTKAISALVKLAENDLDRPSHLWEVLGIKLPVMTVRERIKMINDRIRVLEREGIYFD